MRPAEPRDDARLLVVPASGPYEDRVLRDLPSFLREGDVVVVNDTRVIHAQLFGRRLRGALEAGVSATLIERLGPARWRALARPGKKLAVGDHIIFEGKAATVAQLVAEVDAKGDEGEIVLRFELSDAALDAAVEAIGALPLPPYIAGKRAADARDESDYQTVFAREAGAVAAPTAGLHFTPALIDAVKARGVDWRRVTLHVGAGTFLPVKAQDTIAHKMHAEFARIDAETAEAVNAARARGGRIVAIGTTALRTLESAAAPDGRLSPFAARTDIFITPGHRFRATDVLLTNFHLPRSTLFMLVSAFCGLERMKAAYAHAIDKGYRFYSYGDASLLYRVDP